MKFFLHEKNWSLELIFFAAVVSTFLGVVGAYWDIGWHFDFGRDTFWSLPHLFIYGSAVIVSFVLFLNFLLALKHDLPHKNKTLFYLIIFAMAGVATVFMSAPIDDLWHRLYGIDIEIISLPHLMLLFGAILSTFGIVGILRYHVMHARKKFLFEKLLVPFLLASILVGLIIIFAESEFSTLPLDHPVQNRQPWVYPTYSIIFSVFILALSKCLSQFKWSAVITILFFFFIRSWPVAYNTWWGMESVPSFPYLWSLFLVMAITLDLLFLFRPTRG